MGRVSALCCITEPMVLWSWHLWAEHHWACGGYRGHRGGRFENCRNRGRHWWTFFCCFSAAGVGNEPCSCGPKLPPQFIPYRRPPLHNRLGQIHVQCKCGVIKTPTTRWDMVKSKASCCSQPGGMALSLHVCLLLFACLVSTQHCDAAKPARLSKYRRRLVSGWTAPSCVRGRLLPVVFLCPVKYANGRKGRQMYASKLWLDHHDNVLTKLT